MTKQFKGQRASTPVTFNSQNMPANQLDKFMEAWSLNQAEANHVETIEEANDFEIYDEEDQDFFSNQTVYEMHETAEENLAQAINNQGMEPESNETVVRAREIPENTHDQSAPDEPNSVPEET